MKPDSIGKDLNDSKIAPVSHHAWLYPEIPDAGFDGPFRLTPSGTVIGRLPDSDICLPYAAVSRQHVRLFQMPKGEWRLRDEGSSNGTLVNGIRAEAEVVLQEGDMIDVGRIRLLFSQKSPDKTSWNALLHKDETSSIRIVTENEALNTIISTHTADKPRKFGSGSNQTVSDGDTMVGRLAALYRLSDILRDSRSRDKILGALLDLVFENLPADRAVILSCRESCDNIQPLMYRTRTRSATPDFALSKSIIGKSIRERVAILSRDVQMDSRFATSESMVTADIRSAMCVPLLGKSKMPGILFLDTREKVKAFTEDDLTFVSAMATDAAMTLENIMLAEENLQQERLAAVGETIAGMAHNIKNIMQLSRGGLELMDRAVESNAQDDVATLWPIVKKSVFRMQTLSQEMLDFSRQASPEMVDCDIHELIHEICEAYQTGRSSKSVNVETRFDPNVSRWTVDHDGLCKAMMNLITNAADAIGEKGGTITISTGWDDDRPKIVVDDDGPGIPDHVLPNIFRPFYSTKGSQGNGLGLSMVRKSLEDMGGSVYVDGSLSKGARFVIVLPARE